MANHPYRTCEHALIALAACAGALLPARAQTAGGPLLGSKPVGIVNGKGQVVGGGKSLNIVGSAPKTGAADPKERYVEAVQFLRTFLDELNDLQKDTVEMKIALHANAMEIKELKAYIADLQLSLSKATAGGPLAAYENKLIQEKQAELQGLQAEQDDMIAHMGRRWSELADNLQGKIGETADFPDFQQGLKGMQASFAQKNQLAAMEVVLSAGRSADFRRLADQAEQNPALRMPVLMMRVADYMERGEGRLALYAARLGETTYPDNPAFKALDQGMTVSYLKMIAAKAGADRADVHKAWESYNGDSGDSNFKRVFSGSPRKALDILTGKEFDLEQTQKDAMVRGVAEQNGIELMLRMHDKGVPLDELRKMSPEDLQQRMNGVFKPNTPYEYVDVLPLHRSLQAAFYNPDVTRLANPSKEQFDVDTGHSYYGEHDFDTGILEWAADAVNVKNALLFFGPSAVVRYGQGAGMLTRLSRLGVSDAAVSSAFEGTETVRDALLSTPKLQQVGQYLATTRTGASLMKVLETARYLRYDSNPLVKLGTGITEGLAQMFLFEAGGKIGHALGGDLGEFMGQAVAALAGSPLEDMQKWHVKDGQALEAYAAKMSQAHAKWEATNTLLKDVRAPVSSAVETLESAGTLAPQAVQELDQVAARADQAATDARAAAAETGAPVLQAAADEAEALKNATVALKAKNAQTARVAIDAAHSLETAEASSAEALQSGSDATSAIGQKAINNRSGTSVVPLQEGAVGEVHLEQGSTATKAELTSAFKVSDPPAPGTPAAPDPPLSSDVVKSAQELGDDAMRAGKFDEAKAHYSAGLDKTVEELQNPNLSPGDQAKLAEELTAGRNRINESREAAQFEGTKPDLNNPQIREAAAKADKALLPFTEQERAAFKDVKMAETVEVPGTTGGPRKIIDKATGETIGVWKPAQVPGGRHLGELQDDGQMIAEVMMSRLGRKLGLRIAYAEPLVIDGIPGAIVRWVPDARELISLSPGAVAAVKAQIGKVRALQVLMGNYDIHMANYIIDRAGRVWPIDAGMAQLTTPEAGIDTQFPAGPLIEYHAHMPHIKPSGDKVLDWSRVWRDWYSYRAASPVQAESAQAVRRLDSLITGSDMRDVAQQIRSLSDEDLHALIKEAMPGHPRADDVFNTLSKRRDALHILLNEKWPGALGPAVTRAPGSTARPITALLWWRHSADLPPAATTATRMKLAA